MPSWHSTRFCPATHPFFTVFKNTPNPNLIEVLKCADDLIDPYTQSCSTEFVIRNEGLRKNEEFAIKFKNSGVNSFAVSSLFYALCDSFKNI